MVKICYNVVRSDKVEYTITKKKIKNFIIRIYPDLRIAVSVPLHASNKDVENFIQSKKEWIEITLNKIKIAKENRNNLKENAIKILGGKVIDIERFDLSGNERANIVVKKIHPTKHKYPRGKNLPKIKPLK